MSNLKAKQRRPKIVRGARELKILRKGEEIPFTFAQVKEWEQRPRAVLREGTVRGQNGEGGKAAHAGRRARRIVEVCALTEAAEWIRKGEAEVAGMVRWPAASYGERRELIACSTGLASQRWGRLSGMPENYPILLKPSEWLRKEAKQADEDVETILDSFPGSLQELPKGEIEDKATRPHAATLPGETPQYRKHTYPLSDDRLKIFKETLREQVEKGLTVPAQTPVAAPVFFLWKKGGSLRLLIDCRPLSRITIKDF